MRLGAFTMDLSHVQEDNINPHIVPIMEDGRTSGTLHVMARIIFPVISDLQK
jgi:hypothetical protein